MRSAAIVYSALCLMCGGTAAHALVHIDIDLSSQRMLVTSDEGDYDWAISSARSGFSTPGGSYAPTHLEVMHYSRKYHMSPMPHAIFFRGGYAIHGTDATGSLGRPASHGCVRLSPGHAAALYDMVKREGARISIHGTPPASPIYADRPRPRRYAGEGQPIAVPRYYGYAYPDYDDGGRGYGGEYGRPSDYGYAPGWGADGY